MGTKATPGQYDCYEKAEPDEPMFVLLARDPAAPALVRAWVARYAGLVDPAKIDEALHCADAMDRWRLAREASKADARRLPWPGDPGYNPDEPF